MKWNTGEIGLGKVITGDDEQIRLTLPTVLQDGYHDAQITDYDAQKPRFSLRPPLRLSLRAYATTPLFGTAGFGFWNHPFVPGERRFRLPQAVWFFFSSPPNRMQLAMDVPATGWKCATFNARRWQFLTLLPFAPLGFLLMRIPPVYRRLWGIGQQAIGVSEKLLDSSLLLESHTYTLEWRASRARFLVDGDIVHETASVPTNPLGFIAWVDNQFAIVTPQGQFGFGYVDVPQSQTLILDQIQITSKDYPID